MDQSGEYQVVQALSKKGSTYHGVPVTTPAAGEDLRFVDIWIDQEKSTVAGAMNALAVKGLVDGVGEPRTPNSPRFALRGVSLPLIHLEDVNSDGSRNSPQQTQTPSKLFTV